MKIHLVSNEDNILIGGFTSLLSARSSISNIGKNKWNETWTLKTIHVDSDNFLLVKEVLEGITINCEDIK